MKANELRINNLVNYQEDGTLFNVIGIDNLGISVKNDIEETWIELNQFEPIPLTEEWLLKFGFDKIYSSAMHTTFSNGTILNYYVWHKSGNQYADIYGAKIKCQYVHQLQNLYWCLCGEELEINLH